MMDAYIRGTRVRLDPSQSIGKGGEADVYDIGGTVAAKIFKPPDHIDFEGLPAEQEGARRRIEEHQRKLREFPGNLPSEVIVPIDLVTNQSGSTILGYTMRLVREAEVLQRYGDRPFREAGVSNETMTAILENLHRAVLGVHARGIVIGDFNDLNVLVLGDQIYFIDADSFQFGPYYCRLFTDRFVDPLLCDPNRTSLVLVKPHTQTSDWYAFAVMVMQSLLFVGPYGGVYAPKDVQKQVKRGERPLHRITVFHPEVRYPKPAVHFGMLPDELLHHFHTVFENDRREVFPHRLLEMRWTTCTVCGTMHARPVCPACAAVAPAAVKEVTVVRGTVTATRIFQTRGMIVFAAYQGGLRWLYHESGAFKREDGSVVLTGERDPLLRFRICGDATLIGRGGRVVTFPFREQLAVDTYGSLPVFDANEHARYWVQNGQLVRDGPIAPEYIGDVLAGQTLFWVGPAFGFGFYRAGNFSVSFVFDAQRRGINDTVKLPIRGQLVDSTCVFAKDRCWFFVATQEGGISGGRTINRCTVLRPDGSIEASAEADAGDGSWLSTIRGKCAAGNFLLAATDEGIVRVEPSSGRIVTTREFPDTEPFVSTGSHLFAGNEGLYVVSRNEIQLLKLR